MPCIAHSRAFLPEPWNQSGLVFIPTDRSPTISKLLVGPQLQWVMIITGVS